MMKKEMVRRLKKNCRRPVKKKASREKPPSDRGRENVHLGLKDPMIILGAGMNREKKRGKDPVGWEMSHTHVGLTIVLCKGGRQTWKKRVKPGRNMMEGNRRNPAICL